MKLQKSLCDPRSFFGWPRQQLNKACKDLRTGQTTHLREISIGEHGQRVLAGILSGFPPLLGFSKARLGRAHWGECYLRWLHSELPGGVSLSLSFIEIIEIDFSWNLTFHWWSSSCLNIWKKSPILIYFYHFPPQIVQRTPQNGKINGVWNFNFDPERKFYPPWNSTVTGMEEWKWSNGE